MRCWRCNHGPKSQPTGHESWHQNNPLAVCRARPPTSPRFVSAAIPELRGWSGRRWLGFIALVFGLHVGLIFALGSRKPVLPRRVEHAPALQLATRWSEGQLLEDPTLFALPHPRGFAGASWLPVPQLEFPPFRWTEPPRLLELPVDELGGGFLRYVQTNRTVRLGLAPLPTPEPAQPPPSEASAPAKRDSTFHINGGLANRRWLNAPTDLPPQSAADTLTNSVVLALVDPDGQVISPVLLPPGSGSRSADELALELVRGARFTPARGDAVIGTLLFEWSTLPPTDTNNASAKP